MVDCCVCLHFGSNITFQKEKMNMFSLVRSQSRPSAFLARRWCSGAPAGFPDKPRKFYSKVSVVETTDNNFAVKLDGREIKTKKFRQLRFDQYSMALAVASEFDVQLVENRVSRKESVISYQISDGRVVSAEVLRVLPAGDSS